MRSGPDPRQPEPRAAAHCSPRAAARRGALEAAGTPALAMGATFLAFGAAVQEAGLGLGWALATAGLIYGMPGQMVLLQFSAPGVGGGAVAPAVLGATAVNARFLPMAVALGPLLGGRAAGWRRWLAVPFIAVTPWSAAMRRLPGLPPPERLPWFLGFGLASWVAALLATAAGFQAAPWLGAEARAALLFANPLYFALLLAGGLWPGAPGGRALRDAVLAGAVVAPAALLLPPAWGLLGAGLLGGTLAFLWGRARGRS